MKSESVFRSQNLLVWHLAHTRNGAKWRTNVSHVNAPGPVFVFANFFNIKY